MHLRRIAGRTVYNLYHRPLSYIRKGGPWVISAEEIGKREMEAAAYLLPPPKKITGQPIELHLLTGRKFWYQTAFCLWSFSAASGRPIAPVLFDDGSLSGDYIEPLRRLFPDLRIVTAEESLAKLDALLPEARYPSLRARRLVYPHLKKLLDLHVGQSGYRLQMDSDLLFFRRPDCLIEWHDNPLRPLRSEDIKNSYGYPIKLLKKLSGYSQVPMRINAGVLGLRSEDFDWDKMEYWCRELLKREGPSYFQEQALLAIFLSGKECVIPDPNQYIIFPKPPEAFSCQAVMHHYVSSSKHWYFSQNWRKFIK